MSDIRQTAITAAYLGADVEIPTCTRFEVWATDAAAPAATAMAEFWLKLVDQQGTAIEVLVPAGQTYFLPMNKGVQSWSYNVKLNAVGNKFANIVIV